MSRRCRKFMRQIHKATTRYALQEIASNIQSDLDRRNLSYEEALNLGNILQEVFIGPNATLTNDRHPPSGGKWSPVVVEDKVVIGANATVVAGVRLYSGCVIAAGSVVTKDVPSEEVWAGNPAKFLMTLEQYESRRESSE